MSSEVYTPYSFILPIKCADILQVKERKDTIQGKIREKSKVSLSVICKAIE